jgi:periplasmic protein CpxP/Spy
MESKQWGRRRLFKFAGIGAAIAALGTGLVGKAHAHMRGPMDPAKMDEHLERMLKHLYVEIDATEAQQAKIGPIVKQAAKDVGPLREKFGDTRRQAVALLTADKVDRAAIEKLRTDKLQMADQVSKRIAAALSDVAEVLTPEQRKKLAEHAAHRRWHR